MPKLALLTILVVLFACDAGGEPPETDAGDTVDLPRLGPGDTLGAAAREQETALDVLVSAPLVASGAGPGAGARGTVRVFAAPSDQVQGLRLSIEASGLEPGEHRVRIVAAPCDREHAAARAAADSTELPVREGGFGEATMLVAEARLPRRQLGRRTYSVRLHSAAGPDAPVVACAEL